ncbi:hypothetical protein L1887_55043 [Cichorium endivia]|nr:hypothetical protein L1887_55043 [Cichorium endivia]
MNSASITRGALGTNSPNSAWLSASTPASHQAERNAMPPCCYYITAGSGRLLSSLRCTAFTAMRYEAGRLRVQGIADLEERVSSQCPRSAPCNKGQTDSGDIRNAIRIFFGRHSITHGAVTPIDVVKTRIQLEPTVYNKGMIGGFRQVVAKEGAGRPSHRSRPHRPRLLPPGRFQVRRLRALQEGHCLADGQRDGRQQPHGHLPRCLCHCRVLRRHCPLPSRGHAYPPGGRSPPLPTVLLPAFLKIAREEGLGGFYAGFGPILFKQIPYNMAKFATMEVVLEKAVQAYGKPKSELSGGEATMLNLGFGSDRRFRCCHHLAARRHAALQDQQAEGSAWRDHHRPHHQDGRRARRAWASLAGLTTRLVMVGSITAGQFAIYGQLKSALGATNTVEISKAA